MIAYTQVNDHRPRLNPFIFPSDTDFRFVMLMVATIAATLLVYSFLYGVIPTNVQALYGAYSSCYNTALAAHPGNTFGDLRDFFATYESCVIPAYQVVAGWAGLGVALLLSVTGVIYWLFPIWKIWRGGFKPLHSGNTPPGMMELLSDLCRLSEVSRPTVFLLNPYSSATSGVAFGRFGRRYIVLHRGLVMLFQTDRPAFRAIVLHELAHLRNADVDKTYFTISIVWSFVFTVLLPWVVSLFLVHWTVDEIVNIGWRVLALTVVIYFIRNAVLRTREVYADARASIWDSPHGALGRILQAISHPKGSRWRRWIRTHPDPEKRRLVLEDTSSLFRQSFWDTFVAGLIVAIVLSNIAAFVDLFISPNTGMPFLNTNIGIIATGITAAPLVAGIVGLGTWRAVFAKQARGEDQPGILRVTLGLTLGLLLGQPLSLAALLGEPGFFLGWVDTSVILPTLQQFTLPFLTKVIVILLAGVFLLILMFLFLRWVATGATIWLAVAGRASSPHRFYWLWLVIASGVVGTLLGELSFSSQISQGILATPILQQTIQAGLSVPTQNPVIVTLYFVVNALALDPFIALLFIGFWVYPLASWFCRRRMTTISDASWAFLDTPSQPRQITPSYQAPFRLRLALIVGLAGGLAYCAILLLFEKGLKRDLSIDETTLLAVLLQGGIAAIVASIIQRLPVLHGLFAAFVAGCTMGIGLIGTILLYQDHVNLVVIWKVITRLNDDGVFATTLNEGAFLALLVGLVVSALAALVRRLQLGNQKGYKPVA